MSNKSKNRGHRPPLSSTEPTERITIPMPQSLKKACQVAGLNKIREILKVQLSQLTKGKE